MMATPNPTQVAGIIIAYSKLGSYDQGVIDTIRTRFIEVDFLSSFSPYNAVKLARAYAKLGIREEVFFTMLAERVVKTARIPFKPQQLAILTWAFAQVGMYPPSFVDHVLAKGQTESFVAELRSMEASDLFSALGQWPSIEETAVLLNRLKERSSRKDPADDNADPDLREDEGEEDLDIEEAQRDEPEERERTAEAITGDFDFTFN